MSWDQSPPSELEIKNSVGEWYDAPPSVNELPQADKRSALETFQDATNILNWPANIAAGAKKIDEYTGAPIRKFVTEAVTGKDMDHAPSGAEQAEMLGATDTTYGERFGVPSYLGGGISPADIYGFGLEMAQDPVTLATGAYKGVSRLLGGGAADDVAKLAKQSTKGFQSQAAEAGAEAAAGSKVAISGGGIDVEQGGKLFDFKAPQSLDELRAWKPEAGEGALLGETRLKEIEGVVPDLRTKPLAYHYDMMENPKAMKELKLKFENLPTDDAKKIAAYNQSIVDESANKIKQTVFGISGKDPKNLTDAGFDFIGAVKDKYNAEKDALGPVFEEIRKRSTKMNDVASRDLAIAIGENTKLGKLLSQDEQTGRLFLKKNVPRSGLSNQEHGILASVVDDLNDGMSFQEVQATRDFLRKAIDPSNPAASAEISKVRSVMLDQLEGMASQYGPDVSETFRAYAKNERARESIEQIIGGKVESLDAMFAANPDKVVSKIFSNPNYAKIVSEYVGPEKMNDMVSSYLQTGVNKSFDSAKGFSPHTLKNWLKSNENFLRANVDPEVSQRLNALADYGYYGRRFLDEVNPSGTAASLKEMIEPGGFIQRVKQQGIAAAIQSEAAGRVQSAVKQKQAIKSVNEILGGMPPEVANSLKKKMSLDPRFKSLLDSATQIQFGGAGVRTIENGTPFRPSGENQDGAMNFEGKDLILQKTQGTKYQKVLQDAAAKSEQSLAAAHFVLAGRDSDYRKTIEGGE